MTLLVSLVLIVTILFFYWLKNPICITTLYGRVLFVNRAFCQKYTEISIGDRLLDRVKCDKSGYIELKRGQSGIIKCRKYGLLYFVSIKLYPSLFYINIADSGKIIKSEWPFISADDNIFGYIASQEKLHAAIRANHGCSLELEVNAMDCTVGFLPVADHFTLINLSSILSSGVLRLQTLGGMTAQIAHDLNNLLTGIMGFCELLESGNASNKEFQGIKGNVIQAGDLVQRWHYRDRYISSFVSIYALGARRSSGWRVFDTTYTRQWPRCSAR